MDSSNSGSFQSSSGAGGGAAGDTEEYDSRTQSISSFFNPTNNHFNPNLNHLLHPQPPPSSHHHRPPLTDTTFFNPSLPTPPVRQDRNLGYFATYPINPNITNMMHINTNTKQATGSDHHIGVTLKNPKKRTRASRRAPTTVLTTDTTNFRQMVQEFTGIPTSPFSSTTPLSRRLDLFRPSAQKLQQPPAFLNPAANIIIESGSSCNNNNMTAATTSSGYQLQPSTLLDLHNPILSFQSLLQSNDLNGLQNSSKSWRDQNEKLGNFEGENGRSKLDSGLEHVVSSRSGGTGEQVQGNQDSWICPSG